MPSDYYIKILAVDGTDPHIITPSPGGPLATDSAKSGFLDLAYTNLVNEPGVCEFKLSGDHEVIQYLTNNAQVEVWHKHTDPNTGVVDIAWHRDWSGLFKDIDSWIYTGNEDLATFRAMEDKWWLQDREILYLANTANRTFFDGVKTETIMKTLVEYNAGASATVVNSRLREGAITGLTCEGDGANGNTLDWACAWSNLLTELQKLSAKGGGDFDLIKTGAQTWQFRWYTGQRGIDRSATVKFSLEKGNMNNPSYRYIVSGEKTATVVGGQGETSLRNTAVRTGPNYNASTNNVETFTYALQASTADALNAAGDADLEEKRAVEELTFTALQTPACLYRLHYNVGDKVTAKFHNIDKAIKIVGAAVGFWGGQERIDIITQAVVGAGGAVGITGRIKDLAALIARLQMGEI